MQRKLQDDLDEVNNKWRSVKENFEKFEDDTKERLEDEKRKVRGESTKPARNHCGLCNLVRQFSNDDDVGFPGSVTFTSPHFSFHLVSWTAC